jgi:hypothetical protein
MNEEIMLLAGILKEAKEEKIDNQDFFKKRREGAKKIATSAKAKGGPAMLTFYHFDAKDDEYREVLAGIKNNKPETFYKNKYNLVMNKLHQTKFDKESFQRLTGKLEVWGEAISVLF